MDVFCFKSRMVRLKGLSKKLKPDSKLVSIPNMVRLKERRFIQLTYADLEFQFLYGAIKSS